MMRLIPSSTVVLFMRGLFLMLQCSCCHGWTSSMSDEDYALSSISHAHQLKRNYGATCSPTAPGNFDFYVMSMSYQPEFCYQHRTKEYSGCEHPNDLWRSSLTIHGIWPQNNDRTWPCTCSNETFNRQTLTDVGEKSFDLYWPNVKASRSSPKYTEFWEHEWSKHGTCSGLTQDNYFQMAFMHSLPTPTIVRDYYGMSLSKSDLLKAYKDSGKTDKDEIGVVLVCVGKRFLSEVRVCLARTADGTASHRIQCPLDIQNEGNCGETISISKFDVDVEGTNTIE